MAPDLLERLLLLCRAAAEAGEDWRGRLEGEWLPRVLTNHEAELQASLLAWVGRTPSDREGLLTEAVRALIEAMDHAGYY